MGLREWLARRFGGRSGEAVDSMTTWADIERSELFGWFGVHEVGRSALADGGAEVRLEPGDYQESVELRVLLGPNEGVRRTELALARDWVDEAQTAPFAVDLTKSALPAFTPRAAVVRAFAERLERELGTMRVIMRAGTLEPEPATPSIEAAIDAYRGRRERAELAGDGIRLTIVNRAEGGVASLVLTVEHA